MPCYSPLRGYISKTVNPSGKRSIVFRRELGLPLPPQDIACGQCIGCRLERSRQWAIRCVHEAQLHADNAFITLTYEDKHLPPGGTLDRAAFPKFMKRLRRKLQPLKIRYFSCGEYGSKHGRPHYHACIFGYSFPDRRLWTTRNGVKLYRSDLLEQSWKLGMSSVGDVTFESAAYVARYIVKKWLGPGASEHYQRVDSSTGELFEIEPEYTTMSLKPAIGKQWLELYESDVYPSDEVILRGKKMRPPRYYNGLYEISNPSQMEAIKAKRKRLAKSNPDNTAERLYVREQVQHLKLRQLKRVYEDG
jgi:hypothetical protein